jgi:hypothetical protein
VPQQGVVRGHPCPRRQGIRPPGSHSFHATQIGTSHTRAASSQ